MTKTNITEDERLTLVHYIKLTSITLIRFKAQAVLMADSGASAGSIAAGFDRKPRTVGSWLKDWQTRRLASILTGHADNHNASKLTKEQRAEIRLVLQSPPSSVGLPKEFWDVPQLKAYITVKFGIVY